MLSKPRNKTHTAFYPRTTQESDASDRSRPWIALLSRSIRSPSCRPVAIWSCYRRLYAGRRHHRIDRCGDTRHCTSAFCTGRYFHGWLYLRLAATHGTSIASWPLQQPPRAASGWQQLHAAITVSSSLLSTTTPEISLIIRSACLIASGL